jgi:hypothetical protein
MKFLRSKEMETNKLKSNTLIGLLSIASTSGTLICCVLPAILVTLGLGSVLVSILGNFPFLISISENKNIVFAVAGSILTLNGFILWKQRNELAPDCEGICTIKRKFSTPLFSISVLLFCLAGAITFIAPALYD